jgi:hypothetical protein
VRWEDGWRDLERDLVLLEIALRGCPVARRT